MGTNRNSDVCSRYMQRPAIRCGRCGVYADPRGCPGSFILLPVLRSQLLRQMRALVELVFIVSKQTISQKVIRLVRHSITSFMMSINLILKQACRNSTLIEKRRSKKVEKVEKFGRLIREFPELLVKAEHN